MDALIREGWLAAMIPEEYGGSGLNLQAAAVILEEIHRQGCNAAACHAQMYTMGTVLRHGNADQKRKYLPGIADGSLRLQAFGVTEPTSGTDTLALKTTARREGDRYVVNGQKIWTSRAEHSDLMVLLARTTPREEVKSRTDGLSVFLIDMRDHLGRGLTIRPIRTMMNHATTEIFFDNMEIPADSLIGEEGKGFRYILSGMNSETHPHCRRVHRRCEMVHRQSRRLCQGTRRVRHPIGKNQGVQFPLARAQAHLMAAEAIVYRAAAMYDAGHNPGVEANTAKMLAADASWEAAEACVPDAWRLRLCRGIRRGTQVP